MEKELKKYIHSMDVLGIIVRMVRDLNYRDVMKECDKEVYLLKDGIKYKIDCEWALKTCPGFAYMKYFTSNSFHVRRISGDWKIFLHRERHVQCVCIDCRIAFRKGHGNPHRNLPLWAWEEYNKIKIVWNGKH